MLSHLFNKTISSTVALSILLINSLASAQSPEIIPGSWMDQGSLIEKGKDRDRDDERGPRGPRGHRGHRGIPGPQGIPGTPGSGGGGGGGGSFNTYLFAYDTDEWESGIGPSNHSVPFTIVPASSQAGIIFDGTTATVPATGLYLISVNLSQVSDGESLPSFFYLQLGINGNAPLTGGPYNVSYDNTVTGTPAVNTYPIYGTFLVPLTAGSTVVVQLFTDMGDNSIVIPASAAPEATAANRTLSIVRVN